MRTVIFLFLTLLSFSANAIQTKYILFQPSCMDRLEYRYTGSTTDYVTYQIHSKSSIIALEVGIESKKTYAVVPKGALKCGDPIFDENLVKSINNNLMDVYIVMPLKSGRYRISPVRMASFMNNNPVAGKMIRPDYEYTYNGNHLVTDDNLATSNSESQVFFMGEGASKCEPYHFRSISKNTCRPMSEIYYLHGIGIVEERVGETLAEENENRYVLHKINGVSLDEFKKAHCAGRRIQLNIKPKPVPHTSAPAPKPEPEPEVFVPKKCHGKSIPDHHLVQYGENLYSIARREGVTVHQLRKWNHLRSSKILACSQLRVRAPQYAAAKPAKKRATKKRPAKKKYAPKKKYKSKKRFVAKGVKKAPKKKYVRKVQPKKSTNGVHIVQKGENLYLLATLYGYTVDRFAHMNGLEKNAVLKPGMQLFTTDCSCDTNAAPKVKHAAPETVVKATAAEAVTETVEDEQELPVLSGTKMAVPAERVVAAPKVTYHIVGEGETIWSIANAYGFDTAKLMERNHLEAGEVLIPGQKIYFPE